MRCFFVNKSEIKMIFLQCFLWISLIVSCLSGSLSERTNFTVSEKNKEHNSKNIFDKLHHGEPNHNSLTSSYSKEKQLQLRGSKLSDNFIKINSGSLINSNVSRNLQATCYGTPTSTNVPSEKYKPETYTPVFRMRNDMKCWPGEAVQSEIGKCRSKEYFLQNKPTTYYDVVRIPASNDTEVESIMYTYWVYYGDQKGCCPFDGGHAEDWEGVHVLVVNGRVRFVSYNQHNARYTLLDRDIVFQAGTQRPIVNVGKYSHGSYHDQRSVCSGSSGLCELPWPVNSCSSGCNYDVCNYCYYWKDPRGPGVDWIPDTSPLSVFESNPNSVKSPRNKSPSNYEICEVKGGKSKNYGVYKVNYENTCKRNPPGLQNEDITLGDLLKRNYCSPTLWQTKRAYGNKKGGNPFNDYGRLYGLISFGMPSFFVQRIGLRSGKRVDRIEFTLSNGNKFQHGGSGGSFKYLNVANGDFLKKVEYSICEKDGKSRVCWIRFVTRKGKTLSGGGGGSRVTFEAVSGEQIVGMYGRSGSEVDYLGFITYKI